MHFLRNNKAMAARSGLLEEWLKVRLHVKYCRQTQNALSYMCANRTVENL